jgi:hypothetical protein
VKEDPACMAFSRAFAEIDELRETKRQNEQTIAELKTRLITIPSIDHVMCEKIINELKTSHKKKK